MKVADDKLNKLTVIFVTEQLFAFVFQRSHIFYIIIFSVRILFKKIDGMYV